ncbi:hypothetical protein KSP40_PGU000403 [Platanthera guangdongensis]|uniref:CRM domain-containing protein n=1 Tax=Platanthera guangdongensis TaxID=2320717 RepID=A0ABR2LN01_9ASPA
MKACSITVQRLKRRTGLPLPLDPISSCCSFSRGCPISPENCIFAENRNIQNHIIPLSSFSFDFFKTRHGMHACGFPCNSAGRLMGYHNTHTTRRLQTTVENVVENNSTSVVSGSAADPPKLKRKKLKGKRAVVRWLKFFRWKKKKEYESMTSEEKILFKLKKARKKEERLVEALKKIEPKDSSVVTHDPEVLTPEEHFYLLKLGRKCKNYVPVGRRGIFQGVILNMHLHWKKHQTLQVIVKTFTSEEVREIAVELARLTGGIVLDIDEDNTITMYRGKNYSQPPTEIMSPKVTLTRKKGETIAVPLDEAPPANATEMVTAQPLRDTIINALDKSKYRDAIHAVRKFIPKLEQDLEDMHAGMKSEIEFKPKLPHREENPVADIRRRFSMLGEETFEGVGGREDRISALKESESGSRIFGEEYESSAESGAISESENLSDIFETDSDAGAEEQDTRPLYLDQIERFPSRGDGVPEDFQEHLRRISAAARRGGLGEKDLNVAELDDIDKIFLRAGSLLKKKR